MGPEGGIRWNDWEPAVLSRASREGKLIVLDISATWCHWCHVFDRTSLSDPGVVRLVNGDFVPVRVDTDRRPDINDRYNQGGWPTIAVLLPDGTLLAGATYLPPDALAGLLTRCAEFYRKDRRRIDAFLRETEGARAEERSGPENGLSRGPRPEDPALVRHAVLAIYDPVHPGFRREPKFLVPDILAFLRDAWRIGGDREAGETFLAVLRRMAASEVVDSVEGGFFRYATKRDWTVPHYEKLLPDNAEMLSLYADAFAATGEAIFRRTAAGIVRFLFARLHDPGTGAFMASQDADEAYYPLPFPERARRIPPPVDPTIIAEYNGAAASALAAAHAAFGTGDGFAECPGADLLGAAVRLAGFLRRERWTSSDGVVRYVDGGGLRRAGHLADNVALATAVLDLHDATGDPSDLDFARAVLAWTRENLFSPEEGVFRDRRGEAGDFGALAVPRVPFAGNARAVRVIDRLARYDASGALRDEADRALSRLSAEFDRHGAFAAPYGSVLLRRNAGGPACRPGDSGCGPG